MEDAMNDQSSTPGKSGRSSSKLLQYPLRSATKSMEQKIPVADSTNSSASRVCRMYIFRGRPPSSVSKSMDVLDLSDKGKSARRLSIPTKATSSAARKLVGNITPITETIAKRSINSHAKSDTPVFDVSKSLNQKKFIILSSASYWLSQIKLSEAAAKHSISLGFFKLALEAGCEPLQPMREELKSYARRHNLVEFGELAKELFESYNIVECFEQMQVSETFSHVPEEGTQSSDDDVHSSYSAMGTQKLKPKSLNTGGSSPIKGSVKEVIKKSNPAPRIRSSVGKNSVNSKSTSAAAGHEAQKKSQKPSKEHSNMQKHKVKRTEKKSAPGEVTSGSSAAEETTEENKENMDTPHMKEISLTEG